MVVLQRMTTPMVVTNRRTYLTPQTTSTQWTDSGLMAVLQRTKKSMVITRAQVNRSPVTKSALPGRHNTSRLGGNASHTPERREVRMIFEGPHEVRDSRRVRDGYFQKAKRPPQTVVYTTGSKPPRGCTPQPDDIVFTQADAS